MSLRSPVVLLSIVVTAGAVLLAAGGDQGRLVGLVMVGGALSYLGDQFGTLVGKRRLSFLGLRPKHTGVIIAVATGVAITTLTLLAASLISEDFRDALFNVERLREQNNELTEESEHLTMAMERLGAAVDERRSELTTIEGRLQELQQRNDELTRKIQVKENAWMAFPRGAPLLPRPYILPLDVAREDLLQVMLNLVGQMKAYVERAGCFLAKDPEDLSSVRELLPKIHRDIQNLAELYRIKKSRNEVDFDLRECFLQPISEKNVPVGEEMHDIRFLVRPNLRIFKKGKKVASFEVDGRAPRDALLSQLFAFDSRVMRDLVLRGVSSHSVEERSRQFTPAYLLSLVELVEKARKGGRRVRIALVADQDVWAYGTLFLSYHFQEESSSVPPSSPSTR